MTARWQYFFESLELQDRGHSVEFNKYLNARAAEGWELVSLQSMSHAGKWHAAVVWRR
jgi:Domain of unknown function (DUF4177)